MKNILLSLLCLLSISAFAQQNELSISYQALKDDAFGKGTAINYYRMVTNQFAIGVKANFNMIDHNYDYETPRYLTGTIDLVNRRNFIKNSKKFRLFGEFGLSMMRHYEELLPMGGFFFCGTFAPGERMPHLSEEKGWYKTDHFGFTSGIGFDFRLFKKFMIGANYNLHYYLVSTEKLFYDQETKRTNLYINLGFNF